MKVKLYPSEPAQWREVVTTGPYMSCESIECKLSDRCDGCFFNHIDKEFPISTQFLREEGVVKCK